MNSNFSFRKEVLPRVKKFPSGRVALYAFGGMRMRSIVQQLALKLNMSYDEFVGEMRKRGCSEPTASKIWQGDYERFNEFNENNIYLSNLRRAADVLKVSTGSLFPNDQ